MSKSITWEKMKELFENCSDNTIISFNFLKSFDDISDWFDEEVQKEKERYYQIGYQRCLDDMIRKIYGFDKTDSCFTCIHLSPHDNCSIKNLNNKQTQLGQICPFFSNS